jgi:hypothetical protein
MAMPADPYPPRPGKALVAWLAFCAVLVLAAAGLLAWAVVRLVLHFTS